MLLSSEFNKVSIYLHKYITALNQITNKFNPLFLYYLRSLDIKLN